MERKEPVVSIRLVGGQQVIASDDRAGFLRFYGHLFDRLIREVRHAGNLTRYVAYQSLLDESASLHFLGIEVDEIRDIPKGMVGWDLADDTWAVWHAQDGQDVLLAQHEITWQSHARSVPLGERCVGEFAAL
jgi:predicted transcriptional regulator YdeE